jgi:hypothetical protein
LLAAASRSAAYVSDQPQRWHGIGANATLFSVYDRFVLNPVTIPRPSSLVAIWTHNPQLNFNARGQRDMPQPCRP